MFNKELLMFEEFCDLFRSQESINERDKNRYKFTKDGQRYDQYKYVEIDGKIVDRLSTPYNL